MALNLRVPQKSNMQTAGTSGMLLGRRCSAAFNVPRGAEYRERCGAQVSIVTQSGTNSSHATTRKTLTFENKFLIISGSDIGSRYVNRYCRAMLSCLGAAKSTLWVEGVRNENSPGCFYRDLSCRLLPAECCF